MKTVASIDIGSQTIRLLVARHDNTGRLLHVYRDRSIVRLGEGMHLNGFLSSASIEQAVSCITEYVFHARRLGAAEIFMVATACARNASNADDLLTRIQGATGIKPQVISGRSEALLSYRGVLSVIIVKEGLTITVDIGGGSTEFIMKAPSLPATLESLPLGVISLSEQYLKHDPPLPAEITRMRVHIRDVLQRESRICNPWSAPRSAKPILIGTAGTVTTLAAMDLCMKQYDPHMINNHLLRQINIQNLLSRMLAMPSHRRSLIDGLEPGREIVIISGTLITLAIIDMLSVDNMVVSDAGFLEGILLDKLSARAGQNSAVP